MVLRKSSAARLAATVLGLASGLAQSCASGPIRPPEAGFLRTWADGPAHWLLLPEEERQLDRVHTHAEAVAFVDAFWRRRDPDGQAPGNAFEQEFQSRVEAADRLYGEGATRGSMTDRGRALVLLGPPPTLAFGQKPVPSWDPGRSGGRPVIETQMISIETWTYHAADLPPRLAERLGDGGRNPEVTLVFAVEPGRVYLIEGQRFMDLAVRAVLVEPADSP